MPGRPSRRHPGFQLEEKTTQLRREWRMQRVAWPLLYALLAGCVLGLFGQGPLSRAEIASADGRLRLEYDRFLRRKSDDAIELTLQPGGKATRLRLASAWLRQVDVEAVFPEPEHRVAGAEDVTLVFATQVQQPVQVRVRLRALRPGRLPGWVALDDGPPLRFSQFVYP